MTDYLPWITVAAGALSAAFWLIGSLLQFPLPMGYLSGPPPHVVKRIELISRLNAGGALFAAIAVGAQALSTYLANVTPT